jgi:hypothetical protein
VSLLVTSVLVASGVLLGRWIARGNRQTGPAGADLPNAAADTATAKARVDADAAKKDAAHTPAKPARPQQELGDLFADMPCKLGDVVMRAGVDEAWLAGAAIFSEQHPVAALFVAPDAGTDRAIFVRARPSQQLTWLEPVPAGTLALGTEPPTSLEHAGVRYERTRRLPVKVARAGSGAPDLGEQVILAEYGSQGAERLVVVTGPGTARAWVGTSLEDGMYEILPSGAATLEG